MSEITSSEEALSTYHINTVSSTLSSLMQLQIDMIKTIAIVSDVNSNFSPLRESNKEHVSKKVLEIKSYLEREMENVSDLIFSLNEVVIRDGSKE